jgi:hypothetical protein
MPATSTAQRRLMAIAEHHPSALAGRNRGVLRMTHGQLHDFAATKERGLPHYAPPKKKGRLASHLQRLRGAGRFRS